MDAVCCFDELAQTTLPGEFHRICSRLLGLSVNFRNPDRYGEKLITTGAEAFSCFCTTLQTARKGPAMCMSSDLRAIEEVKRSRRTYVYRCHAGLTEVAIPVVIDGQVQAVLLTGQFICSPPDGAAWERVGRLAADLDLDADCLYQAYCKSLLVPQEKLDDLVRLLSLLCDHVAGLGHELVFLRRKGESDVVGRIKEYIRVNHQDDCLSLRTVSRHVHLSPSYVSRLFHRETGATITHHINEVRIQRSKAMLSSTRMTVSEVCHVVGYRSLSHFTKTFKNSVGVSPRLYRQFPAGPGSAALEKSAPPPVEDSPGHGGESGRQRLRGAAGTANARRRIGALRLGGLGSSFARQDVAVPLASGPARPRP